MWQTTAIDRSWWAHFKSGGHASLVVWSEGAVHDGGGGGGSTAFGAGYLLNLVYRRRQQWRR